MTKKFFRSRYAFFGILLAILAVRYFPFGFRYFPFSDDYNQYGVFALFTGNLWQNVIVANAWLSFRPLAGLADVYIISRLWGSLHWVLLAVMFLHFASIILLDKICTKSNIAWGRAACIVFALLPPGEAVYWISASSRIVPATFFMLLAVYAMLNFLYRRKGVWLAAALVCGVFAQGYYEQAVPVAFVFTLGILILHRHVIKHKIIYAWPFFNVAVFGVYHGIVGRAGHMAGRSAMAEGGIPGIFRQIPLVIDNVFRGYVDNQGLTFYNTVRGGFGMTQSPPLFIITFVLAALLALFLYFEKDDKTQYRLSVVAGIILFASAFVIFPLLQQRWVFVRNLYFGVFGLAILAQVIWRALPGHNKISRVAKACLAWIVILVVASGAVLEIRGYRDVETWDSTIVANMIREIDRLDARNSQNIWLFGTRWNYGPVIGPHITSQVRIDWAVNGHFSVMDGRLVDSWIIPVTHGNGANPNPQTDAILGIDHMLNVRELRLTDDTLYFADTGEPFGTIYNGIFWILQ